MWDRISARICFVSVVLVTMVGAFGSACQSDGSGQEGASVSKSVGPGGGTLRTEGMTLEVPEGALESEVELTVSMSEAFSVEGYEPVSSVYRFRPSGQEFQKPVRVQFSTDAGGQTGPEAIYWSTRESQSSGNVRYEVLPTTADEGGIWAEIDHFSRGFVGSVRQCGSDSGCRGGTPCNAGYCYEPACSNGRRDGLETDVDCGGPQCGECTDVADAGFEDSGTTDVGTESDASSAAGVEPPERPLWAGTVGSKDDGEFSTSVAADGQGGVYVGGEVYGTNGADVSNEEEYADGFVARYGPDGSRKWLEVFSTELRDYVHGLAVDADGDLYVTGETQGVLGETERRGYDAFLAKYDREGNRSWLRQFGTDEDDRANDVVVSDGMILVGGSTRGFIKQPGADTMPGGRGDDGFLVRFSESGELMWRSQVSPGHGDLVDDVVSGVDITDDGAIYVAGWTRPGDSKDGMLARYDRSGSRQWLEQFGTSATDRSYDVAATDQGVYAVGNTTGTFGSTQHARIDGFLIKFDTAGEQRWVRQIGSPESGSLRSVTTRGDSVYVGGYFDGELAGEHRFVDWGDAPDALGGDTDPVVMRYGPEGDRAWATFMNGVVGDADLREFAIAETGRIYIAGRTTDDVGDETYAGNSGTSEAYVVGLD